MKECVISSSNESRIWYFNLRGKAQGPFPFSEIEKHIGNGELLGHFLVFKTGATEWKQASEWEELKIIFAKRDSLTTSEEGAADKSSLSAQVDSKSQVDSSPHWIVLVKENNGGEAKFIQKGPFKTDEVSELLRLKQLRPEDHCWTKGFASWKKICDIDSFSGLNFKIVEESKVQIEKVEILQPQFIEVTKSTIKTEERFVKPPEKMTIPKTGLTQLKPNFPVSPEPEARPAPQVKPENKMDVRAEVKPEVKPDEKPEVKPDEKPEVKPETGKTKFFAVEPIPLTDDSVLDDTKPEIVLTPIDTSKKLFSAATLIPPQAQTQPLVQILQSSAKLPDAPQSEFNLEKKPTPDIFELKMGVNGVNIDPKIDSKIDAKVETIESHPEKGNHENFATAIRDTEVEELSAVKKSTPIKKYIGPISAGVALLLVVVFGLQVVDKKKEQKAVAKAQETQKTAKPFPETNAKPATVSSNVETIAQQKAPMVPPSEAAMPKDSDLQKAVDELKIQESASSLGIADAGTQGDDIEPAKNNRDGDVAGAGPSPSQSKPEDSSAVRLLGRKNSNYSIAHNYVKNLLEIRTKLKPGETVEVNLNGKTGKILNFPGLNLNISQKVAESGVVKIDLRQLTIPDGYYRVVLKSNSLTFDESIALGKNLEQLRGQVARQRKGLVYEYQQEKKKLLSVIQNLSAILNKAQKAKAKSEIADVEKRVKNFLSQREIQSVQSPRSEIFFFDAWSVLHKTADSIKKGENKREPASFSGVSSKLSNLKTLENKVRAASLFKDQ